MTIVPKLPPLALALLLAAQPSFAASLSQTIQKSNDAFAAAFNRGDGAAVAAMYTEQATILPPGSDMMTGRPAVQRFWEGAIKAGLRNISLTTLSATGYGPAAREIGRFSFDAPAAAGQTTRVEGKYVVIWKRAAGKWLLDTDIWNTNK